MMSLEPTSAIVSEAVPYWSANGGASSPFCGLTPSGRRYSPFSCALNISPVDKSIPTPSHHETVFDSDVSDDVTDEDYEDNRDVEEEDADSDGDCVAREEVSDLPSTCNTKKNVRPKVRAKKDVSSGSAIVEALSAKVTLL